MALINYVTKHNIGDRDSSAYQSVVDSNPYQGLIPEKVECIGHVQKRVGSGLKAEEQLQSEIERWKTPWRPWSLN